MRSIPAQIKSYAPGFALALIIALLAKGIEALLPPQMPVPAEMRFESFQSSPSARPMK